MKPDDLLMCRALGHRIKSRRTALGITLPALAEKAKISKGALSRIEHGGNPCAVTIFRLAHALDCSPLDLMPSYIYLYKF